jgi:peptidoglycan LD-endopeptidase LytH
MSGAIAPLALAAALGWVAAGPAAQAPQSVPEAAARALAAPAEALAAAVAPAVAALADAVPPALPAEPLLIPVQGVQPRQLSDTYTDSRGSGRLHEAIDIMAPTGTPVLAVADGHVEKLFYSKPGGITLYQFDTTGRLAYYYAHLESYAAGIVEGRKLRRGEVIGYVGASGNANPAAPHLHFAVLALGPEKRWWKGTPSNPYPLMVPSTTAAAAGAGEPRGR